MRDGRHGNGVHVRLWAVPGFRMDMPMFSARDLQRFIGTVILVNLGRGDIDFF